MKFNPAKFLILALAILLLITGCTQPDNGFIKSNKTTPISIQTIPAILNHLTPCPPNGNTAPWIIINPIGKHYKDEEFEINGTTNLDTDEKLLFGISQPAEPRPLGNPQVYHVASGNAKIVKGGCNVNYWFFRFNSSGFPIDNSLTVSARNGSIYNDSSFGIYGFPSYDYP